MLLIDKGYFDYDFERVEKPEERINWEQTIKSDEEVREMLAGFGFGAKPKTPETLEEIQEHIIKQEGYGRS